jgi:hypothetical protein
LKPVYWGLGLAVVTALALALRLHGIADPIMDHPGWRQGDTAAIARNFAQLRFNPLFPQTTYNGPPPNYVELELQIVPFLAAIVYKLAGVHVVIGRLLTVLFSLATVVTLGFFARRVFNSASAGLIAAFCYAVFPGSVYYGRTFMPDCAMTFFLTAALFAAYALLNADSRINAKEVGWTTLLFALAFLAKPVAVLALVPLGVLVLQRARSDRSALIAGAVIALVPLALLWLYDRQVAAHAEWHWASGITRLHVLPALSAAFASGDAFLAKCIQFRIVLGMFRETMLGSAAFWCSVLGFAVMAATRQKNAGVLWGWLAGGAIYIFVVVTVERVDYYMLALLPLCALVIGGLGATYIRFVQSVDAAATARTALLGLVPIVALVLLVTTRSPVEAYYGYNVAAYRGALLLDRSLPSNALLVIGHYGPDLQYYMNRFGWEEDPLLWTPFDEESAIAKGARYFVAVEDSRLNHNLELCAYLQRFSALRWEGPWTVYVTDPRGERPGAMQFWRAFRTAERAGRGRAYLDGAGVCKPAGSAAAFAFQSARSAPKAPGPTAMLPRNG